VSSEGRRSRLLSRLTTLLLVSLGTAHSCFAWLGALFKPRLRAVRHVPPVTQPNGVCVSTSAP
jgi:hypothetical protein